VYKDWKLDFLSDDRLSYDINLNTELSTNRIDEMIELSSNRDDIERNFRDEI